MGDDVEVYSVDSPYCPVLVTRKYKELAIARGLYAPYLPFFRQENGRCYNRNKFNVDLKLMLRKHVDYKTNSITTHSFCAGVPTMLSAWGFNSDQIKGWGRWSSSAYLQYCKLPTLERRRLIILLQERFETSLSPLGAQRSS